MLHCVLWGSLSVCFFVVYFLECVSLVFIDLCLECFKTVGQASGETYDM